MEPEILTHCEIKAGEQPKQYPKAPAHCLAYIQIINAENVAKISVSQIKQLAKKLSFDDVFSQIEKFSDTQFQELAEKLITINNTEFLYILCTIIFMCSDEGIDILEQCGGNINAEHQGEKAVTVYLNNPNTFEIALDRLLFTSVAVDRTYHVFQSKEQIPEMQELQTAMQYITGECKNYFQTLKRGDFCQVKLIPPITKDRRLGFFIEHAGNLKSKPVIDLKDRVSLFYGRNLIGDFAMYDPSLKLVLISSRSTRHCEFYSRVIGKAFWDNKDLFNTQAQLDLSFLKKQNIQQLLNSCCVKKIRQIQIKKIQSVIKNTNKHKTTVFQPPLGKNCLTHDNNLEIEGNIMEVELKITLNMDGKTKSQKLLLKPKSVKSGQLISPFEIQHIFKQLGLIKNENP